MKKDKKPRTAANETAITDAMIEAGAKRLMGLKMPPISYEYAASVVYAAMEQARRIKKPSGKGGSIGKGLRGTIPSADTIVGFGHQIA